MSDVQRNNMCPPGNYMDDFGDCLSCASICQRKMPIWRRNNCQILCPDEFARLTASTTVGTLVSATPPPSSDSSTGSGFIERDIIIAAVVVAVAVTFAIIMFVVIQKQRKKKKKPAGGNQQRDCNIEEGVAKKIVTLKVREERRRRPSSLSTTSEYSVLEDTEEHKVVRFTKKGRNNQVGCPSGRRGSGTLQLGTEQIQSSLNGHIRGSQRDAQTAERDQTTPKRLDTIQSIAGSVTSIAGANQSAHVLNEPLLRQVLETAKSKDSVDRFSSSTTSTQTEFFREDRPESTIREEHFPIQISPDGNMDQGAYAVAFHPNFQSTPPLPIVHSFATRSDQSLLRSSGGEEELPQDDEVEYEPADDGIEGLYYLPQDVGSSDENLDLLNITPTAQASWMS